MQLDVFTTQYIRTLLWSSLTPEGEPIDATHGPESFAPESLARIVEDCAKFQRENEDDVSEDPSRAGHDLCLTRNGHGAGFWDGGWKEPEASRLTRASEAMGESLITIGDDGKLYV